MVLIPPTKPPSAGRTLGNHEARIRVLERRRSGSGPRIVAGQLFNDADIIAGTGFGATLTDVNEITVTFDVPFDDPPTVVTTANNNNPADVAGEYGVSQTSVTASGFVVVSTEFDGTALFMGGFNFVAVETEPVP